MNTNLSNKIDSLLKTAEERRDKTVIKGKTASFVYVLLAVFVVIYTSILFSWIKESVKADSLSAILKNVVSNEMSKLPTLLDELVDKNAENIADNMVAAVYEQIPSLEKIAKDMIDEHSEALLSQIQTSLFPQFHDILRENAEAIKIAAEALSDEEATKELAKILVKKITEEIDYNHGIITSEAEGKLEEIRKHLDDIAAKPLSELTLKEAAQRKIIVSWLYLMSKHESLGDFLKTLLNRTGYSWEHLLQEFGLADSLSAEPNVDTAVEIEAETK